MVALFLVDITGTDTVLRIIIVVVVMVVVVVVLELLLFNAPSNGWKDAMEAPGLSLPCGRKFECYSSVAIRIKTGRELVHFPLAICVLFC